MKKPTPLVALYLSIFSRVVGYFVLFVVFAVLLLDPPYRFTTTQIALILGVFSLADFGFSIFWAPFLPKFGFRRALIGGGWAATFCLLAACIPHFWIVLLSLTLFGFFGSLVGLAGKLWVSTIEDQNQRLKQFSRMYQILNVGAGIGPLIGFWLYHHGFRQSILLFTIICYIVSLIFLHCYFFTEKVPAAEKRFLLLQPREIRKFFSEPNVSFVFITMMIGIFAFIQLQLLPLYCKLNGEIPSYMGPLISLNPLIIVLFQGKITQFFRWCEKMKPKSGYLLGLFCMLFASTLLVIVPSLHAMWMFVVLLTFGEMFIFPHGDYTITENTPKSSHASLLALSGVVVAIGRSIGESSGASVLGWLSHHGWSMKIWWGIDTIVVLLVVLWMLKRIKTKQVLVIPANAES